MDWLEAKHLGEHFEHGYACARDRWDIPETWLPMHYFEALNCFFRIENALRLLVYIGLKRQFREGWENISISTEDDATINLRKIAKMRARSDERFAYLVKPSSCPLMYLTAGELVRIMFSEAYWKLFRPYFDGGSGEMKVKLEEITCIRNALAHFRPISTEQLQIVKQNGRQLLQKFNNELKELLCEQRCLPRQ